MTEEEWTESVNPGAMYLHACWRASRRQARLLMVGLCQLVTAEPADPRVRLVLETAERCADDPALEASANASYETYITTPEKDRHFPEAGPEAEVAKAVLAAWEFISEVDELYAGPDKERYASPRAARTHAVFMSLRGRPQEWYTGGDGDAVVYCIRGAEFAVSNGQHEPPVGTRPTGRRSLADILRCVLGNPVRPAGFEAEWRTEAVVGLARGMYESRDFSVMPVLADALEDAGCHDDDVLSHCRGGGPHVRGCWVVDAVLGRE